MSQITILTKKTQVGKPFVTLKDTPEFAKGGKVEFDGTKINGSTLAVGVRELVKQKFPKLKFSITSSYSSLNVYLMVGNFDIYKSDVPEEERRKSGGINAYNLKEDSKLTPEAKNVFKTIDDFISKYVYNRNANDPYADYVDYNVYVDLAFGKWDKPYERIGGDEKPSKPSSGSFPSKPKTPVPEGKKALYEYGATVEYSTVKGKYNGKIVYIRWVASTEQFLYTVKNGDKTYSVYEPKILGVLEDASPTEEPMPEVPTEPTPTTEPTPIFEQKYKTNSWVLYNSRISRVKEFKWSTGLYKIIEFDANNIDTEALTHKDLNESELSVDLAVNPLSNKIKWIYLDSIESSDLPDSQIYTNWTDFQKALEIVALPSSGYLKAGVFLQWDNGKFIKTRIDLGRAKGDFNSALMNVGDYLKAQTSYYSTNLVQEDKEFLSWDDFEEPNETWELIKSLLDRKKDLYSFYNEIYEDDDLESEEAKVETRKTILSTYQVIDELTQEVGFNPSLAPSTYFDRTTDDILTDEESIKKVIDSLTFRIWFGNYDINPHVFVNDSSSVTSDGKPLMVYHGTTNPFPFSKFSFKKFPVMYFADNKEYAQWFANRGKGIIYSCFLNIKFPLNVSVRFGVRPVKWIQVVEYLKLRGVNVPEKTYPDSAELTFWQFIRNDSPNFNLINAIKEAGYDGIIQQEDNPSALDADGNPLITNAYMIFKPNQVKVFTKPEGGALGFNNIMYMKHGGKITDSKIIEKKVSFKNKLKSL